MNNIIQLVFDPNDIAVVKTEHSVKVYRLDEEARLQRKSRARRKRKIKNSSPGPAAA